MHFMKQRVALVFLVFLCIVCSLQLIDFGFLQVQLTLCCVIVWLVDL